jgi:CheY-like chemotaxis protein
MADIAILEDNALMRRYLADLIGQVGGHATRVFETPTQLVEALASQAADLVVVDIGLGPNAQLAGQGVDGLAVSRHLKGLTPAPAVMLLTAHAFDGDEARFLEESQADAYEPKPIRDEDAFLAKLLRLLTRT